MIGEMMTYNDKIPPCVNCITLAMCQKKLQIDKNKNGRYTIGGMMNLLKLEKECPLLKKYFDLDNSSEAEKMNKASKLLCFILTGDTKEYTINII